MHLNKPLPGDHLAWVLVLLSLSLGSGVPLEYWEENSLGILDLPSGGTGASSKLVSSITLGFEADTVIKIR